MKKKNYKLHKELGILECYVHAVKIEDLEKKEINRQRNEDLGIHVEDEDIEIIGEPKNVVVNIENLGGISYFHGNEVTLESDIKVPGTFVEFKDGLTFIFLIAYNEFKKLYFDYMKKYPTIQPITNS
jgi:hypothetical protein